jgi:CheY-like chemotaxis protein
LKNLDKVIRDNIEKGTEQKPEREKTHFPPPIILVVEDKAEEQVTANQAVRNSGLIPVVAATLADAQRIMKQLGKKIVGIITDLHFPEDNMTKNNPNPPAGLAIIAIAVKQNLPITVCSDINHHFAEYIRLVTPALAAHPNYTYGEIFLTFDRKDWVKAVEKLLNLMKGGKS